MVIVVAPIVGRRSSVSARTRAHMYRLAATAAAAAALAVLAARVPLCLTAPDSFRAGRRTETHTRKLKHCTTSARHSPRAARKLSVLKPAITRAFDSTVPAAASHLRATDCFRALRLVLLEPAFSNVAALFRHAATVYRCKWTFEGAPGRLNYMRDVSTCTPPHFSRSRHRISYAERRCEQIFFQISFGRAQIFVRFFTLKSAPFKSYSC